MENLKSLFGKLSTPAYNLCEMVVSGLSLAEVMFMTLLSLVVGTAISMSFLISGKNAVIEIGGSTLVVFACMVAISTLIKIKNKRAS